jgi:hypothetical protein
MEYASFHYLMHKVEDPTKPTYMSAAPPLQFHELYSPRDRRVLYKGEKSYWRTRDRIEYTIIEERSSGSMIITCYNVVTNEPYRTIFLNLELLYFELDSKVRESKTPLTKKKDKALDDTAITKAAVDYILLRLMIQSDPLPFYASLPGPIDGDTSTINNSNITSDVKERMCTFEKLSSDTETPLLEKCPPVNFVIGDLQHVKLAPSTAAISTTTATDILKSNVATSVIDDNNIQIVNANTSIDVTASASTSAHTGENAEMKSSVNSNTTKKSTGNSNAVAPAGDIVKNKTTNNSTANGSSKTSKSTSGGKGKNKIAPSG